MAKITFSPEIEAAYSELKTPEERGVFRDLAEDAVGDMPTTTPVDDATTTLTATDRYTAARKDGMTQREALAHVMSGISHGETSPRRAAFDIGYNLTERIKKVGRRAEQFGFLGGVAADIVEKRAPKLASMLRGVAESAQFSGGAVEGLGGIGQAGVLMGDMVTSGLLSTENATKVAEHAATNAAIRMWDPKHEPEPLDLKDEDGNSLKFDEDQAAAINEYYTAMAQTPQYAFAVGGAATQALVGLATRSPWAAKAAGGAVSAAPVGFMVFRDSYIKAVEDGLDDGDAVQYAVEQAGAEFIEQLFSMSALRGAARSAAKANFIKGVAKAGATEFASEGTTSVAQAASEQAHIEGGTYREGAVESGEQAAKAGTLGATGGAGLASVFSLPSAVRRAIVGEEQNIAEDPETEKRKWKSRMESAKRQREERDRVLAGGKPDEKPAPTLAQPVRKLSKAEQARLDKAQATRVAVETEAAEEAQPAPEAAAVQERLAALESMLGEETAPQEERTPTERAAEPWSEDPGAPAAAQDTGEAQRKLDALDDVLGGEDGDFTPADLTGTGEPVGESAQKDMGDIFEREAEQMDWSPEIDGQDISDIDEVPEGFFKHPAAFGGRRKVWPWKPDERYTVKGDPKLPTSDIPRPKGTLPIYEKPWRATAGVLRLEAEETDQQTDALVRFFQANADRDTDAKDMDPFLKSLLFREAEVYNRDAEKNMETTRQSVGDLEKRLVRREGLARLILEQEKKKGRQLNAGEMRDLDIRYAMRRGLIIALAENEGDITLEMADGSKVKLGKKGDAIKVSTTKEELRRRIKKAIGEDTSKDLSLIPTMKEGLEAGRQLFGTNTFTSEDILDFSENKDLGGALSRMQAWTSIMDAVEDMLSGYVLQRGETPTGRRRIFNNLINGVLNAAHENDAKVKEQNRKALAESVEKKTPTPRPKPSMLDEIIAMGGGAFSHRQRRHAGMRKFMALMMMNRSAAERLAPQLVEQFDKIMARQSAEDRVRFADFQRFMHITSAYAQTREGERGELNPDVRQNFFSFAGGRGFSAVLLAHESRDWRGLFLESAYWDTGAWDDIVKEIMRKGGYPSASLEYINGDNVSGKTIGHVFDIAEQLGLTPAELNAILRGETFSTKDERGRAMNVKAAKIMNAVEAVEADLNQFLVRMGARAHNAPRVSLRQPAAQIALFSRGLLEQNRVGFGSPRMQLIHEFAAQIQLGLEQRYDALAVRSVWNQAGVALKDTGDASPVVPIRSNSRQADAFREEAVDKFVSALQSNRLSVEMDEATGQMTVVPARSLEQTRVEEIRQMLLGQLRMGQDQFQILVGAGSIKQRQSVPGTLTIVTIDPNTREQVMLEAHDKRLVQAIRPRTKLLHGEQSQNVSAKTFRALLTGAAWVRAWRQLLITAKLPFIVLQNLRDVLYTAPLYMNAGVLSRIPFVNLAVGYWTMAHSAITGTDLHDHESKAVRMAARYIQSASRFNDLTPQQTFLKMRELDAYMKAMRGNRTTKEVIYAMPMMMKNVVRGIYVSFEIGNRLGAARMVERAGKRHNRNMQRLRDRGYVLPGEIGGANTEELIPALLGMMDAVGSYVNFGDRPSSEALQYAGRVLDFANARMQGMAAEARNMLDKATNESARGAISQPLGIGVGREIPKAYGGGYIYQAALMTTYATVAAFAAGMYIASDEEALEDWRSMPQSMKDLYLLFPALGNTEVAPDDPGVMIKIPTPYGAQAVPITVALGIMNSILMDNKTKSEDAVRVFKNMIGAIMGELYAMDDSVPWFLVLAGALETGKYIDNPFADAPFDVVRRQDQKLSERLQASGVSDTMMALGFALNEIGLFGDISPAGKLEPYKRAFAPGAGQYIESAIDMLSREWRTSREDEEFGTTPIDAPSYNSFWRKLGKETGVVVHTDVQSTQGFYRRAIEWDTYARSADKVFGARNRGRNTVGDLTDLSPEKERYRNTAKLVALGLGDAREEAQMVVARKVREGDPFDDATLARAMKVMQETPTRIRDLKAAMDENLQTKYRYDPATDGQVLVTAEEKWEREQFLRKQIKAAVKEYNYIYDKHYLPEVRRVEQVIRIDRKRAGAQARQNIVP